MKVHHYGFLTKDIDKSIEKFICLGYKQISERINDKDRGIDILFLESNNNQVIELVSPNSENSVVDNLIKTQNNSVYHICYITKNIEQTINALTNEQFILIDSPKKAVAFNGKKVAFMMSKFTGIIELLEE